MLHSYGPAMPLDAEHNLDIFCRIKIQVAPLNKINGMKL
jgi:hypothetical protein